MYPLPCHQSCTSPGGPAAQECSFHVMTEEARAHNNLLTAHASTHISAIDIQLELCLIFSDLGGRWGVDGLY
jgi:hypothetical protein